MCFLKSTLRKVRFGGTPKPARETRALPGILFVALIAICAHAATPLTAEIKPLALRPRTLAPETLDVKLNYAGSALLEGALELIFIGEGDGSPRYRSHDLALTGGAQSFRLLIPAAQDGFGFSREVRARFATKTAVLDLGRFDFGAQPGGERSFTICVSKPRLASRAKDFALWQSLRLERFQPKITGDNSTSARTLPVHVETEEMPATALGCTPYDLVLLEDEGFTLLRERQLAALSRWVLAGGSICIGASVPLEAAHRKFLAELLAADARALTLNFAPDGRVDLQDAGGTLLARPGFGRLVVVSPGPQSEAEAGAEAWKRAAMFLWKFRAEQVAAVLRNGAWDQPLPDPQRWHLDQWERELSDRLSPKHIRILPYPIMLLVLAGFVLVIGPLDWFALGRLRMRWLTWLLFPLAAVAFTGLTVFLAGYYMGKIDDRRALTVTDLGRDGRVLRETRIELLFPAKNREVNTDVQNALCSPISTSGRYSGNRFAPMTPVRCEGLFPARYVFRQSLRQWTPQMNRQTSLDAGEDKSGLPWAQLHPAEINRENLRQRLAGGAARGIYLVNGGTFSGLENGPLKSFVQTLAESTGSGWRQICTHFSLHGGGLLDDLAFGADGVTTMTIIEREEGEGFHIYRRLY